MRADVLITEDLISPWVQQLSAKHHVVPAPTLWNDPQQLRENLTGARTVMIRNQTKMTREVLQSAPNLLAIGRVGVGLDNIDLTAASELGIVVIAPLDANAVSVAELTIGLIIALARKIPQADRSTKSGQWDRRGCTGLELQGKTLVICGFGRIGRLVAARARAFGLRIMVFDPYVKPDAPELIDSQAVLAADLFAALSQADFLTLHLPLTSSTRGLIDRRALDVLKPGAFLLNTSRGGIVDETALIEGLQSGRLGGAALDVRETEPPAGPNPFVLMDNVILTPHIASFTTEAQGRTFEAVCSDLNRILRGEPARNFVNFANPKR